MAYDGRRLNDDGTETDYFSVGRSAETSDVGAPASE
jgi:hypothetical protein